jgi:hypothetical protein
MSADRCVVDRQLCTAAIDALMEVGIEGPALALHAALAAAPAAPAAESPEPQPLTMLTDEQIDAATSTARDSLLDHIYEYGTVAEGTMPRARNLARAAIAEFCRINGIGAPHD